MAAKISRDVAEERIKSTDPYNARYYQAEIDRCNNRIAYFQPEVEAFTWVIEEAFGEGSITPKLQHITAELRHLYKNMVDPRTNADPVGMAKGILSYQISRLEDFTK